MPTGMKCWGLGAGVRFRVVCQTHLLMQPCLENRAFLPCAAIFFVRLQMVVVLHVQCVVWGPAWSQNSPEETPNPRRDSKKTGRYRVCYCLWCVSSPCFLGVSSWVSSLLWRIHGYVCVCDCSLVGWLMRARCGLGVSRSAGSIGMSGATCSRAHY